MKLALLIMAAMIAGTVTLFMAAIHWGFRAPRQTEQSDPGSAFGFAFEQAWIPAVAGKRLFAWFLPADTDQTIIILHGWGGNAELMLPLAAPFRRAGLNVLLFDARNHGRSDAHSFSSMPRFAEDLGCAIDWLQANHPAACGRLALLGHSVGAAAVLLAASRRSDISAVISVSAFAHPEWVMRRHLQRIKLPLAIIRLVNRYVQWVIGHAFADIAPLHTVCKVKCPVLLVHGTADSVVPLADAHAIVSHCPDHPLELLEIADAGHASVDKIEAHAAALLDFLQHNGVKP